MQKKIKFSAEVQKNGNINAAFVDFPFSTEELFGKKGQVKIKAIFYGATVYSECFAKMDGNCQNLGNTRHQKKNSPNLLEIRLMLNFGKTKKSVLWKFPMMCRRFLKTKAKQKNFSTR